LVCRAGLDLTMPRAEAGRRTRVRDTSELHLAVARYLRALGLELGELHQGDSGEEQVMVWTKSTGQIAVLLPGRQELPLPAATRFGLGAQCAALRLGISPLVQADRNPARDLLFAATLLATDAPQPTDATRLRPLANELARRLSRKERRELEAGLAELPEPGQALHEVAEDARAGAYRAGTLLAQDLAPALVFVFGEDYTLDTIVNSKLGLRLLRFWTSQTCLALLRGLGARTLDQETDSQPRVLPVSTTRASPKAKTAAGR